MKFWPWICLLQVTWKLPVERRGTAHPVVRGYAHQFCSAQARATVANRNIDRRCPRSRQGKMDDLAKSRICHKSFLEAKKVSFVCNPVNSIVNLCNEGFLMALRTTSCSRTKYALGHKRFAGLVCEQEPLIDLHRASHVRIDGGQEAH
jgi:hypothetical protein